MKRTGRGMLLLILALLFAAGPIVAGLIRTYSANDSRLLWMAFTSLVGVSIFMLGRSRTQKGVSVVRAVIAFAAGTVVTMIIAFSFIGARSFAGVGAIAVVMSFFWTMGYVLDAIRKGED